MNLEPWAKTQTEAIGRSNEDRIFTLDDRRYIHLVLPRH